MIRPFEMKDKRNIRKLFLQENIYHHQIVPRFINQLTSRNIMNTRWLQSVYDNPDREILVDERDGKLVGLLMFTEMIQDDDIFTLKKFIHVNELVVDEKNRGRGIGKNLMAYVEDYAKDNQMDGVRLEVWQANEGARSFYDKGGYEITKEIRFKRF